MLNIQISRCAPSLVVTRNGICQTLANLPYWNNLGAEILILSTWIEYVNLQLVRSYSSISHLFNSLAWAHLVLDFPVSMLSICRSWINVRQGGCQCHKHTEHIFWLFIFSIIYLFCRVFEKLSYTCRKLYWIVKDGWVSRQLPSAWLGMLWKDQRKKKLYCVCNRRSDG